jgi:predicted anti-sigma-YlaC factor YlaD
MKDQTCREFQEWLEGLPLSRPTAEMKRHFAACARCRKLYDSLAPLAQALSEVPSPAHLSAEKIRRFAAAAEKEALRVTDRRTAWNLARNILMALPFITVIHWLWLDLGSRALSELLSPLMAQIFSIMVIITSSLAAALLFGAVPLLWTGLRRN